ncbi:hypothetical protein [Phaeovulum sp. W22_SRMD_FR3]|uniref:hypothetical protein n=1 Tax=Phaeovulum sp. W22_SRMD_FR3 TaxID=3240274 RepID=UPI003F9DC48B
MHKKNNMGFQTGSQVKVNTKVLRDAKSGKFVTTSSTVSRVERMEQVIESTGKRLSVQESRKRMLKQLDLSFKRLA